MRWIAGMIAWVGVVLGSSVAQAATNQQISDAIARGKAYLYSQQSADGTWERSTTRDRQDTSNAVTGAQWGGLTAIATHALLASGESPQDARLAKAIEFLKKAELVGVYSLAMRCQVMSMLPQTAETKAVLRKDALALMSMMKTQGDGAGFYDYMNTGPRGPFSLSRAQYAALGLWVASYAGAEVPDKYWQVVEKAWVGAQDPSGGWKYRHKGGNREYDVTPGITAAGVATLFITQDFLQANAGIACRGNIRTPAIDRGMKWMVDHFDMVATNRKYSRDFHYATLYAVERIGVASGYKYFGEFDWYAKGSNWLISKQEKDGSWHDGDAFIPRIADTCFAILFLERGRAPIVMNKLQYDVDGKEGNWNQRPRDAANVARWIGKTVERDLTWQIVNLKAPVKELLDAPLLYIAGNQALNLTDEDKARLKSYLENGGLILAHADCGTRAFADSVRALGKELFPEYDFRELPADHLIMSSPFSSSRWKTKPSMLGMSNGVRELIVLVPQADPGKTWQIQAVNQREELWQLAANLFLYSADRQSLRYRGESYFVDANPSARTMRNVKIARLQHSGNWNPEPGGWIRLKNILQNENQTAIEVTAVKSDALTGSGAKVAHLTGTGPLTLSDADRTAMKEFVAGGGTLVIDAAGGNSQFASAVEVELKSLFPDPKLEMLSPDHPLYQAGGAKLDAFFYRAFAKKTFGGALTGPRVQGMTIDGRLAVIYSREDLSAGMVGQSVDGVMGYSPETATEIMRRIVAFVAGK